MGNGVFHIPAGKTFLILEKLEKRICIIAIYLDLLEAGKFRAEVKFAELVDTLVSSWGLLAKLIAGKSRISKPCA